MMILAGDIGGTKTNVAIFETENHNGNPTVVVQRSFPSAEYESLEAILEEFTGEHKLDVTGACFGVAGPVVDDCVETPNLAWRVCARTLAEKLRIERVKLINDLEATAGGIESLQASQLRTLNEGDASRGGNLALIAAGTGLGMAGVIVHEGKRRLLASEGGHADFAPRTEAETELLRYLRRNYEDHISYERVLSGPGLFNIYSFLRDTGFAAELDWLAEEFVSDNHKRAIAAISKAALAHESELAVEALDLFVRIYGAAAGNLALTLKATGGVFIGGGIAPKIVEKLADGTFMRLFTAKGRLTEFLRAIPVRVILDEKTALYGAARCALHKDE